MVGREILFGCVLGIVLICNFLKLQDENFAGNLNFGSSVGAFVGFLANVFPATMAALALLCLLCIFQFVLRRDAVAIVPTVLVTAALTAPTPAHYVANVVVISLVRFVLMQFGLLALAVGLTVSLIFQFSPMTLDPGAWYSTAGFAAMALLRLLSVSLIVAYFIIVSLRALFDLPTERAANWVFRSTVDRYRHESGAVAMKVVLTMIVPWLVCVALPLHIFYLGWTAGVFHTGYVLLSSMVLAELLLARFRKIPFTCMHTGSKDRVLVMVILGLLGLVFFGSINARLEIGFFEDPTRLLVAMACVLALLLALRSRERNRPMADRALIFEDRPPAVLQVLNLSKPRKMG
jgi:hypothetical protein